MKLSKKAIIISSVSSLIVLGGIISIPIVIKQKIKQNQSKKIEQTRDSRVLEIQTFKKDLDLFLEKFSNKLLKTNNEVLIPNLKNIENSETEQVSKKLNYIKNNYINLLDRAKLSFRSKIDSFDEFNKYIDSEKEKIKSLFDLIEKDENKINTSQNDYIKSENERIFKDVFKVKDTLEAKVLSPVIEKLQKAMSDLMEELRSQTSDSEKKEMESIFTYYESFDKISELKEKVNYYLKENGKKEIILTLDDLNPIKLRKFLIEVKNFLNDFKVYFNKEENTTNDKDYKAFLQTKSFISDYFSNIVTDITTLDFNNIQKTFYNKFIKKLETFNNEFREIEREFEEKQNEENYDFKSVWVKFSLDFYQSIKEVYDLE